MILLFWYEVLQPLYLQSIFGGLAQLARAFAWHAKGHRFDSGNLHFTGQLQIFEELPGFLLAETLAGIE